MIQPTLLVGSQAHAETINLYCNPDGTHIGSGWIAGKNWTAASCAIGAAGTGYAVNDYLYATCPLMAPYSGFNCRVTSVGSGGSVTGVTLTNGGAYDLPPVLQAQQWTAANGYANVFDGSGHFNTYTGGSGTGATLIPTWQADFIGGNYDGGAGLIGDCIIGHVNVQNVGRQLDSTYGPCFGSMFWGLNFVVDEIESGGGYNGVWCFFASDLRFNKFNPVNAVNNLVVFGGNSVMGNLVIDTCFGGSYLTMDNTTTFNINVSTVNGGSGCGAYPFKFGANSSSGGQVIGGQIRAVGFNCGTTSGVPAFYMDYCNDFLLDLDVCNRYYDGSTSPYLCTSMGTFGTHNGTGIEIRGSFNSPASGSNTVALFNGTVPNIGIHVWDGTIGGFAGPNGIYTFAISGAPASTFGQNKAGAGSLYMDISAGTLYSNKGSAATPNWTIIGGSGGGSSTPTGYSGQQYFVQQTLTDGSSIAWNMNTQQAAKVTLGGNRTLANPTNLEAGGTYTLIVSQDATGGRTLAYGTDYKWPGATPPVLSTAANAVDVLTFLCDGTNLYGSAQKAFG